MPSLTLKPANPHPSHLSPITRAIHNLYPFFQHSTKFMVKNRPIKSIYFQSTRHITTAVPRIIAECCSDIPVQR